MLYVLSGEDAYRSRKKLRDIEDRFYAVAGGRESAVRIVLSESSRLEVEQVLTTGSLFRNKRLFILEEPSAAAADAAVYLEEKLPLLVKSDDIYVIWDRVPTPKQGFFAAAASSAVKAQEFKRLTAQESARFLDEEARMRGISPSSVQKRRILMDAGGDSWRMVQELEKAAISPPSKYLTGELIPASSNDDRAIFSLMDAYGLSQRAKAWQIYNTLVHAGMEPEKIFWRLLSHTRTLLSIYSLMQRGAAAADIPRAAGVHPFVAKKAAVLAARVSLSDLTGKHASLVNLDFQAKQSRGDVALGLERILLNLSI